MKSKPFLRLFCFASFFCSTVHAAIVEMPDTKEEPAMERQPVLEMGSDSVQAPDPTAGPRLNIAEIRVQGIEEYPELGVTREALNKLVEAVRFAGEDDEISDLKAAQAHQDNSDLIFAVSEQRQLSGLTVGMLETVAGTITRYYRERGFILAKVYIPQQRVRDGVVVLMLLPGNLGEVAVLNAKKYREKPLENIFTPVIGKPVTTHSIEERLYLINDLPGLSAQAYFEPGSQVGETRLNINVRQEKKFNGNIRIDNQGSESTGEYRLYADGYWHNPSGFGDQLHIGILGTFEPSNSLYGAIHYGVPFFSPWARLTIGGSTNDFVSDSLTGVTFTGKSVVYDAALSYFVTRSRAKNASVEMRISEVTSDIEEKLGVLSLDEDELDDTVRNLDLLFNFDVLLERWRALHQGELRLTYGDFAKGRGIYQDENPVSLSFSYWFSKFAKVPFTDNNSRLQVRIAGQYSDTSLPGTSQFTLTGPNKLRAFNINQYIADLAAYLAVDWFFEIPRFSGENVIQPYIFWEAGYGDTKDGGLRASLPDAAIRPERPGSWALMSDVGAGLRFSIRENLRGNFNYAYATSYEADLGPSAKEYLGDLKDRSKVYFDLLYSF